MKKIGLISLGLILSFSAFAEDMLWPEIINEAYCWKISPNGKWMMTGDDDLVSVVNLETFERFFYEGCRWGQGNCLSNTGINVGQNYGRPVLMYEGSFIHPESFKGVSSCSFNAVTPEVTRICGNMRYSQKNISGPFYCDIDSEGNFGEPKALPKPDLDFFGCQPQFINALSISEDGKNIVGFVQDWRGLYCYPIVYTEKENGEWEYSFPSEYLFNTNKVDIPENPFLNEPKYPEPINFMSPIEKAAYQDAMEKFILGIGEMPEPIDFMNEEEWETFKAAVEFYNEWYYGNEEKMNIYFRDYATILGGSIQFELNSVAIKPSGEEISCAYYEFLNDGESMGLVKLSTIENHAEKFTTEIEGLFPTQFLPDRTLLGSVPLWYSPNTYISKEETGSMVNILEYLIETNSPLIPWMEEYIPNNTGMISINNDKNVFVGSILPGDCDKYMDITGGPYVAFSYVFKTGESGIGTLAADSEGDSIVVYNLQGVKMGNSLEGLNPGIYIVNGKKVKI